MTHSQLQDLKYPIGQFETPEVITNDHIVDWINDIKALPQGVIDLVEHLSNSELNYPYRPEGWTIQQVVHHLADSHMNSIIRFKLAITEDSPTIRPYFEDRWATLKDYDQPIDSSLSILNGVHEKLGVLLSSFSEEELAREFIHPEHGKRFSLKETIGMYAWHSNHHLAHIRQALTYKGEF
ncbi:putative metal-dependent hydrolase [Winogradskyella maritima]|uniref:YfiT family bacillithiol transferase n=1 Tax=Winogradskyella maritima TaxID=1517766 RepID=A0ABV8ANL1_9FLAO|nr:putative metal-dependent hydrolase [Winogradskyella maritima]